MQRSTDGAVLREAAERRPELAERLNAIVEVPEATTARTLDDAVDRTTDGLRSTTEALADATEATLEEAVEAVTRTVTPMLDPILGSGSDSPAASSPLLEDPLTEGLDGSLDGLLRR